MQQKLQIRTYNENPVFAHRWGIPLGAHIDYHFLQTVSTTASGFFHPVNGRHPPFFCFNFKEYLRTGQIRYEYNVLKCFSLQAYTGTLFCDDSGSISHDLVCHGIPGRRKLDYGRDSIRLRNVWLTFSAEIENPSLLSSLNTLFRHADGMPEMFHFTVHPQAFAEPSENRTLLALWRKLISDESEEISHRCCINTELNSGNFHCRRQ